MVIEAIFEDGYVWRLPVDDQLVHIDARRSSILDLRSRDMRVTHKGTIRDFRLIGALVNQLVPLPEPQPVKKGHYFQAILSVAF